MKIRKSGFTVVELLVIIVIIGILSTLVVVSYTNISSRAIAASLQSDLTNNAGKLKLYMSQYGTYPTAVDTNGCPTAPTVDNSCCLARSGSNSFSGYTGTSSTFTLNMVNASTAYRITESTSPIQLASIVTFVTSMSATGSSGDVVVNSDGSYVIAGNIPSNGGIMSKFDSTGNLIWSKKPSGAFRVNAITKTSDGGYALTGSYNDSYGSVMTMKTDSNGVILWTKLWAYGTTPYSYTNYGNAISQTSDGGFIVAGSTQPTSSTTSNIILKYDSSGNLSWSETIPIWNTYSFGGAGAGSIIQTSDGGYALVGLTNVYGAGPLNGVYTDLFLVKLNSDGSLNWSITWGNASSTESGYSLVQTADGGYVISGYGGGGALIKFNSSGNTIVWTKNLSLGNSINNMRIITTSDGGFAVSGSYAANYNGSIYPSYVWLGKFNSSGSLSWGKAFGASGSQYNTSTSIMQTLDDGYVIGGSTTTSGTSSTLLLKYDSNGSIVNCGSLCTTVTPTSASPTATLGTTAFTVNTSTYTASSVTQTNNTYAPTITPLVSY